MSKTLLEPIEVFNVVKSVPSLMEDFRKECYSLAIQETLEYKPDGDKKYDHRLGLAFLKKHGIPNTREDLFDDGKYTYVSVMDGQQRYNVGQFIVLFSETIYSSGDMTSGNTWVLEVMDEFHFPADKPLVSLKVESIREALHDYLSIGIVRLHPAGVRMYKNDLSYGFEERLNNKVKENEQAS